MLTTRDAGSKRLKEIANWRVKPTEGFTLSSFSPDGKLIALSAIKDGESGIWVKQIGGGDPVKVTGQLWQGVTPVWSPDSEQLGNAFHLLHCRLSRSLHLRT
ncbi:MAG: hypothetical protein AB1631_31930 [Acidobacteriota bacterium]